jgi:hypothetical protein
LDFIFALFLSVSSHKPPPSPPSFACITAASPKIIIT